MLNLSSNSVMLTLVLPNPLGTYVATCDCIGPGGNSSDTVDVQNPVWLSTLTNNSNDLITDVANVPTLVDGVLNVSHDEGAWTTADISSLPTESQIDARINVSHGQGLYNQVANLTSVNVSIDTQAIVDEVDARLNISHSLSLLD